jgi:hypothetical protein
VKHLVKVKQGVFNVSISYDETSSRTISIISVKEGDDGEEEELFGTIFVECDMMTTRLQQRLMVCIRIIDKVLDLGSLWFVSKWMNVRYRLIMYRLCFFSSQPNTIFR